MHATIEPPRTWTSVLTIPLLEAAILGVEALLVAGAGWLISAPPAHFALALPNPVALALAYLLFIIGTAAYAKPPHQRARRMAMRVLGAVFAAAFLLSREPIPLLPWLVLWCALAALAVSLWRWAAIRALHELPPRFFPTRNAAFIGNSEAAARLLREIQADPRGRFHPVGFFDDRNSRPGPLHGKLPYLGTIDELVSYIHDHDLRDVYMALPWTAGDRIAGLLDHLRFLPLTVHLIPDQSIPALRQNNENAVEGIIMPTLMLPPFSATGGAAKRALDLLASALLLIALSPLFLLVALAIRLDSKGPIFFRQRRIGQYGHGFNIYKFRSLKVAQADATAETLVSRGDSRVTRVGKYLRKYSIDELPQIINVLLGDMSLVGPRPHAPRAKADQRIYAEIIPDYMLRYRVKPGMTGWAQINGWRGNTDTEEKLRKRVEFDFAYIKSWSFLKDLEILVMTIPSALFPPPDNA